MPKILVIKDNRVMHEIFEVEGDLAVLSDVGKCGDVYDPATGLFSEYVPPAPEPTEAPQE